MSKKERSKRDGARRSLINKKHLNKKFNGHFGKKHYPQKSDKSGQYNCTSWHGIIWKVLL